MEENPYMDGRGLRRKTRELIDRMWATLPGAWLGSSAALGALLVGPMILYARPRYPDVGPSVTEQVIGWSLIVLAIAGGICATIPWFQAKAALQAHRRRMNEETAKRGAGWARD